MEFGFVAIYKRKNAHSPVKIITKCSSREYSAPSRIESHRS